jgi:hypothetical protein
LLRKLKTGRRYLYRRFSTTPKWRRRPWRRKRLFFKKCSYYYEVNYHVKSAILWKSPAFLDYRFRRRNLKKILSKPSQWHIWHRQLEYLADNRPYTRPWRIKKRNWLKNFILFLPKTKKPWRRKTPPRRKFFKLGILYRLFTVI